MAKATQLYTLVARSEKSGVALELSNEEAEVLRGLLYTRIAGKGKQHTALMGIDAALANAKVFVTELMNSPLRCRPLDSVIFIGEDF